MLTARGLGADTTRVRMVLLASTVSVVGIGCAPALREPRSVSALASASNSGEPAGKARQGDVAASARQLCSEAREAYARRPDLASVKRAESLFLEAAVADGASIEGLVGAVEVKGWLVEHERDGDTRAALARSAVEAAQWCDRRAPGHFECDYALALGLGLQARENPSTANDALKIIVERLRGAIRKDARLDRGGPHRVLALLLLRAPGWPAGPGDPEEALAQARAAVALFPDFPPNQIVLSEALRANDLTAEARAAAERALTLAARATGEPDAHDWSAEAAAELGKQ